MVILRFCLLYLGLYAIFAIFFHFHYFTFFFSFSLLKKLIGDKYFVENSGLQIKVCNWKLIFFSAPIHMLWVCQKTVAMRWIF